MSEMTSHERFTRMFEHREADRIPVIDDPWDATIARWQREGMPEDVSYVDYFGLDKRYLIGVDNSPQYERRTVEETDEFVTTITEWGTTLKNWKMEASTPQFLDFTIVDRDSWAEAKARMVAQRRPHSVADAAKRTTSAGATKATGYRACSGPASTSPIPGSWAPSGCSSPSSRTRNGSPTCSTTS